MFSFSTIFHTPHISEIMTPPIPIEESEILLHDEKFLADLGGIIMLMKKDFNDSGHLKSGRYYLPEALLLSMEGRKSGLLANLILTASVNPCGATYQCCYSETPMIRCRSKGIDDLSTLRIQYWDNSSLFMKSGYPVGVIIPTEIEIEWLITPSEDEKTLVDLASSSKHNQYWSVLTIPNTSNYLNHKLFFVGHLDNDNILQDIGNVLSLKPRVTDEQLEVLFEKLRNANARIINSNMKMVVINPNLFCYIAKASLLSTQRDGLWLVGPEPG